MTNVKRQSLRKAVIGQLDDDMMPLEVGGHAITDRLVYAGCSQWHGCGRNWDETRSRMAWIVDGKFQLTFPDMDYFNGQNQIERQTRYYLQPDRSETPPVEPIGEPLLGVPDKILLEIARGCAESIAEHNARQTAEDLEAGALAAKLTL